MDPQDPKHPSFDADMKEKYGPGYQVYVHRYGDPNEPDYLVGFPRCANIANYLDKFNTIEMEHTVLMAKQPDNKKDPVWLGDAAEWCRKVDVFKDEFGMGKVPPMCQDEYFGFKTLIRKAKQEDNKQKKNKRK